MLPSRDPAGYDEEEGHQDPYPPLQFPPAHTTPPEDTHTLYPGHGPSQASPHYPSYPPPPYPDTTPVTTTLTHQSAQPPEGVLSVAWQSVEATRERAAWEDMVVVEQAIGGFMGVGHMAGEAADVNRTCEAGSSGKQGRQKAGIHETAVGGSGAAVGVETETGSSKVPRPRRPRQRKMKVYEWPQQEDPHLEQKRQRAVREYRKRQKEDEEERELKQVLHTTQQETAALRHQITKRRQMVEALEQQVAGVLAQVHTPPHHHPPHPS